MGVKQSNGNASALDFPNLISESDGLDILEMNLQILTKVNNRPELIVEAYSAL